MGRLLLFLVAAAAGGSLLLNVGQSGARSHTKSQQQVLVRQTLDDAVATVLDAAVDPARRVWRTTSPLGREFEVDGYRVTVDSFIVEPPLGTVLRFQLTAYRGGVAQRIRSRYRIPNTGWPGPLWIDAPYAVLDVDKHATMDGGDRKTYFDATRFNAFRLGTVLSAATLESGLRTGLAKPRGTRAPLEVVPTAAGVSMSDILARYGTPTPLELVGRAMSAFGPGDRRFTGSTEIESRLKIGALTFPATSPADARIVHVEGDLTIGEDGHLSGNGLLLVDGDLTVEDDGQLQWTGLVVVRPRGQHVVVDFDEGEVDIRGAIVVDQEAPPPGGHTDLTVNRDLTGAFAGASSLAGAVGETGSGTPGHTANTAWVAGQVGLRGLYYDHEHRFEHRTPEQRKIHFAERRTGGGSDRHEAYTWFRRTLNDFATANPGERLYVRFKNPEGHGASLFTLATGEGTFRGGVATGFGAASRPGDAYASPSFLPSELATLIVDVQSLRLLNRLIDGDVPASPFWAFGASACPSRPMCIGYLPDRDGSLVVQLVRDSDDRPVYEASVYWHTQAPGSTEYIQEIAADDAWRAAVQKGAEYGTFLQFGKDLDLSFLDSYVAGITGRLGFGQLAVEHLGSVVEYLESRS